MNRRVTVTGCGGHIATEERWELLAEVKALVAELRASDLRAEEWKAQSMSLARRLNETVDENVDLRAQLAQWELLRTSGGPPKPYSGANWANAKLSGNRPPPYSPAIDTGRVT